MSPLSSLSSFSRDLIVTYDHIVGMKTLPVVMGDLSSCSLLLLLLPPAGCEMDMQMDGVAKLAPVVAFYAGKPDMLARVEAAVRVTQGNDACVAETLAAARLVIRTAQRTKLSSIICLSLTIIGSVDSWLLASAERPWVRFLKQNAKFT